MKQLCIYGHYGSGNHGNEAIIRGIASTLKPVQFTLYSMNIDKDIEFGLNEICNIRKTGVSLKRYSFINILGALQLRIFKKDTLRNKFMFKDLLKDAENKLFVFEMGDQYCESKSVLDMYRCLNKMIKNKNGSMIALGGSINENQLDNKDVLADLNHYSLIIVRESLTYNALKKKGFVNLELLPDPAFAMNALKCKLPSVFCEREIVGVVVGGVAQGNEEKSEKIIRCIVQFIQYVLDSTNYGIALIPHVRVGGVLDDVAAEKKVYMHFKESNRITLVAEQRADQQKYIISKCKMLVTLRTHASIAAYSSEIPTIVLGYSIKSKGIAQDLFREYEPYVVDINCNDITNILIEKFIYMDKNYMHIKEILHKIMPDYIDKCSKQKEIILKLLVKKESAI